MCVRIILAFRGNNEAFTAAGCINPSKDWDTLIEQSTISILTAAKPLLL